MILDVSCRIREINREEQALHLIQANWQRELEKKGKDLGSLSDLIVGDECRPGRKAPFAAHGCIGLGLLLGRKSDQQALLGLLLNSEKFNSEPWFRGV